MKKTVLIALTAAAAVAGAASAQPQQNDWRGDRGGSITFYERPDFQGRSFTLDRADDNFVTDNFNDRAQSARVDGVWRVCEHVNYQGRCEELRNDVRDLNRMGLGGMISSAAPVRGGGGDGRPPWGGGPGGGGGWDGGQRTEGRTVVFFAEPRYRGRDIPGNRMNADLFCRSLGYGQSIYFDASQRGRAMNAEGREGNGPVLRDLLCRKR